MQAAITSALLTLLLASACHAPQASSQIAFEPQVTGQIGFALEAKNLVARSAEEWRAICRPNAPGISVELEKFDWSKRMLIAVALGSRPSGGYAIQIDRVSKEGSHWVVHARETRPAKGSMQTAMLTSPFDCVSTPRFEGKVDFIVE